MSVSAVRRGSFIGRESELARPAVACAHRARIEALPDAVERPDQLAYHWWQAEDTPKARLYNERAAAAALATFAFADAATYLQRTLSLCDDPLERARLLTELGAAQRSNGNPDAAVSWCLAATDSFTARGIWTGNRAAHVRGRRACER
ncbi:MAG: hypothetical protein M3154_01560 [Candidatus Eremiobacteraeota bacterium]|nr:hypothetical protein [Candidatus Eremiobacteraeota bacterium]